MTTSTPSTSRQTALTLRELELFDPALPGLCLGPGRGEQRALCPLCGPGKPRDGSHRCLSLNRATGLWRCHRCGAGGKVREAWEERSPLPARERARLRLSRSFDLPAPTAQATLTTTTSSLHADALRLPDSVAAGALHARGESRATTMADSSAARSLEAPEADAWKRELGSLQSLGDGAAARYLAGRGLSVEGARRAGARSGPCFLGRDAIVFPLRDLRGVLRGAHARYIDGRDRPKARTLGDKCHSLFATPGAFDARLPALIVTEAPLDALSLAEAGYPALAVCGTQAPHWMHRAGAFRRVLLAFDADDAGDRAAETLTPELTSFGARCERLRPDGFKDWNEALQAGRDVLADWLALQILPS